ncbi:unnamed protein product [Arabidopsis lyrata]|nr:unnamed protein product [Arabidopsis lyrata]
MSRTCPLKTKAMKIQKRKPQAFQQPVHKTSSSVIVTPERYSIGDTRSSILEAESPLNMSVNSHALKRRKFHTSPVIIDLEEESSNATNTTILDPRITRRIEFGVPNTCLGVQVMATVSSNVQFMSKILFFADHPSRSHE